MMTRTHLKNRCHSRVFPSGVQNALSGFPLKTCLHAEVRRFGTQACGNDNSSSVHVFEITSSKSTVVFSLVFLSLFGARSSAQESRPIAQRSLAKGGYTNVASSSGKYDFAAPAFPTNPRVDR